jgi:hypothetical protein
MVGMGMGRYNPVGNSPLTSLLVGLGTPRSRNADKCEDRLTPYPDTRAAVGKVEVTAVTSPLH